MAEELGTGLLGDDDHDQDDEQLRAVAKLDQGCDGSGRGRSMLPVRSVQQSNHCAREEFLYTLQTAPTVPPLTTQASPLPPGTQPNGQPRRLQLRRGHVTSRYPAQALDPLTNSLTATVRAPADTDLLIFVVTGHGTRLGILTDLHGPECRITGRQATCTVSEDQAVGGPGVWQVVVVKSSKPAAVVEVTLTWVGH